MKTYHSFVFAITHDIIEVGEIFHTTVPKRYLIGITLSDEDVKQGEDAVNIAFYKACEEYKKILLKEQMYHGNKDE